MVICHRNCQLTIILFQYILWYFKEETRTVGIVLKSEGVVLSG